MRISSHACVKQDFYGAVPVSPLKNLLELSVHEKMKMLEERLGSLLHEFKNKVKNALVKKSQKQEIYHEIKFEAV
jgi:hypothetical protein